MSNHTGRGFPPGSISNTSFSPARVSNHTGNGFPPACMSHHTRKGLVWQHWLQTQLTLTTSAAEIKLAYASHRCPFGEMSRQSVRSRLGLVWKLLGHFRTIRPAVLVNFLRAFVASTNLIPDQALIISCVRDALAITDQGVVR